MGLFKLIFAICFFYVVFTTYSNDNKPLSRSKKINQSIDPQKIIKGEDVIFKKNTRQTKGMDRKKVALNKFFNSDNKSNFINMIDAYDREYIFIKIIHQIDRRTCNPKWITHQGRDKQQNAYWNVSCTNGMDYLLHIPINNKRKIKLLDCKTLKKIGVDCSKRFK